MRPTRARVVIVAAVAACLLVLPAGAQPPTGNAALRYWMAFALLQDPPADAATTDLVQRVADGKAPWDESRLGPILDANGDALEIMRRGSTVRACDWGIEYRPGHERPDCPSREGKSARAAERFVGNEACGSWPTCRGSGRLARRRALFAARCRGRHTDQPAVCKFHPDADPEFAGGRSVTRRMPGRRSGCRLSSRRCQKRDSIGRMR